MPFSLDTALLDVQYPKQATTTSQTPASGTDIHIYNAKGVIIDAGTWTDGTFTFDVEESDDGSTWTSVDSADLSMDAPVIDAADEDDQQYYITYSGNKKYLRATCTVTGSPATGLVFGMYALGADATEAPVR